MEKETYNSLVGKIEILNKLINGGKGSGNFGHGGRPGKVGGSSQSGGLSKGQSVESEHGGEKGTGKTVRKPTDKEIKPSKSEYIKKMSEYVKSKGKTSVDMTKSWSVEDAAKKYLDKANVSVEDFDDIYSLKVDYKDYSSSTPISKESKEEFKKDFSKAIVESQEQIFGQDSSSALVSTSESRKYTEEVISKIQKELDIK